MMSLTILATDMRAMANNVPRNIVAMQREVALHVVEHVANSTPIDTGQAAGNWNTSIGSPNTNWIQGPSSPGKSYRDAQTALSSLGMGQDVHITNNVPYIALLNSGYSNQAPSLFVETAIVSAIAQIGIYNILTR